MDIKTIRQNKIIQDFNNKHSGYTFIKKSIGVELYSRKKINLCYKTLTKPKISYYFHYLKENEEYCLNVGKIVYNSRNDLIEDLKHIEHNFKPDDSNYKPTFDYKNCNFITNQEKKRFLINELWFKGEFKKILEVL